MLTFDECCSLSGLSHELVAAIAEHEEIPEMVALELGAHLLSQPDGATCILRFIEEDIAAARRRCDERHANELTVLLLRFREEHTGSRGPPQ